MLAVSNNLKDSIKQGARQFKAIFVIHGEKYESSDKLLNFKVETAGEIFGASMRKLSFKILGARADFNEKMVKAGFGALVGENFEMIDLGEFFITEANINLETNTTEIIAYDRMVFTHKQFEPQLHNFPTTVQEFAAQIANVCSLELLGEIENGNLEIPTNYFEKSQITYRDILKQIAQLSGSICLVSGGKLVFRKLKTQKVSETLTDSELRKFKFTGEFKPANVLVLSRTPQEDNIYFPNELPIDKHQIKIENNEFLDKRRNETAERVFNAISGLSFSGVELSTIGLGYFEAGDRIAINAGGKQAESFIFSHIIEFNNGFKENIKTITPEAPITNFKRASNIIKRVFNTEIIVDKQKQEIASIISQKEKLESETFEKFSRFDQTLADFNYTISKTGGLNLLKNSAFYSFDEKTNSPNFWNIRTIQNLTIENSAEARSKGAISGRKITIQNNILTQTVVVASNFTSEKQNFYSFSCRVKKPVIGSGKIEILDGETVARTFEIVEGTSFDWAEVKIEGILPQNNALSLKITANANSTIAFADLNLVNNKTASVWTQAQGEISNANLHIDEHGLIIKSSVNEGDYTAITPLEFSGYSKIGHSIQRVFTVNKDTTEVKKFKAEDEIDMSPIKIVAIKDGEKTGWAFVANSKGER